MADPAVTVPSTGACRTQRVVLPDGQRTWTVLDADHRVVEPAEQYLEYSRIRGRSPNTVKSYARALALWCEFLAVYELAWDAVTVEDLGRFLGWLRTGDSPTMVSIDRSSDDRPGSVRGRWRCGCRRSARSTATTTCSRLAAPAGAGRGFRSEFSRHRSSSRDLVPGPGDEEAVRGLGCLLVDRGVQSPGRGTRDVSSASRLCRVNSSASPVTPHRARGRAIGSHVAERADERRLIGGDRRRPPPLSRAGARRGRRLAAHDHDHVPVDALIRAERHSRRRRPVCRGLPDRRAAVWSAGSNEVRATGAESPRRCRSEAPSGWGISLRSRNADALLHLAQAMLPHASAGHVHP
jgi:Phage integrase, N-terminal SAM-like domain